MILYYALTTYHIQCCVLHRLTKKPDEEAVLLLSDIHKNSVAFLSRYRESKVFDNVFLLEESQVNSAARQNEAKHRSKRFILNTACRSIKKILPVDVEKMDDIYLCPDHFPFGWYIIKNKIKYHCFEEGCGVLSDNEFMLSNMKRNKAQYKLMDVLGYFGSNDSAVEILADEQCQKEGYHNPKMTDFSVTRILNAMPDEQRKRVLSFFGVNQAVGKSEAKNSLILTQHMANLGIMPLEDQHLLYRLFADYFLENTYITVKPHPDDIAGRYNEIFGENAAVLPFAMPSELLPYTLGGKLKIAIAAYSTAVKSLGNYSDRIICFDNRIMTDFKHLNRYFAALMLVSVLSDRKSKITTNANEMLLNELSQSEQLYLNFEQDSLLSDIENAVIISDNLPDSRTAENICSCLISELHSEFVIFLNEQNKHVYFDGVNTQVFRHIRPIFIDISDKDGNTANEVIYLYSNDENILSSAEKFQHKKELKYTGVTLDIHSISRSDSEKIRMLEGVLEATEARLKEYIANKKQLDRTISKQEKRKHI
ncbi:MAG: hypothetical protein ACI4W1_00990 [Ruminococcus sp.]